MEIKHYNYHNGNVSYIVLLCIYLKMNSLDANRNSFK